MSKLSSNIKQINTLYKNNLWQGRLVLGTLITLLVLVIVRISLPYTIVYSAVYWLGQQGIASQIEDITINVTNGTFAIINATGTKHGNTVFNIGNASIDWKWRPLSKKTIHITEIILEDFNLRAARYSDAVDIGGVVIKQGGAIEQLPKEEEQTVAWSTALDQIDLKNFAFCFQQFDNAYNDKEENRLIDYCGDIDLLSWHGRFALGTTDSPEEQPAAKLIADGTIHIKQLNIHNNLLDGTLINIDDALLSNISINGINDINLDSFNINQFALLEGIGHSRHKHGVEFSTLDITGITLNNTNSLEVEAISLSKPVASIAKDNRGAWKFEQWIAQQSKSAAVPDVKKQTAPESAFSVKLGTITVSDAEACYDQPSPVQNKSMTAIDYCINLAASTWKGNIAITVPADNQATAIDIKGDFELTKFVATNNSLNKNLLAFGKLAINKINFMSVDDLAFDKLDLDDVAVLELANTNNKHAAIVSSLDVSALSYRKNSLSIHKLAVNDLGLDLTQNKAGKLDFEQWKINTAKKKGAEKSGPDESSSKPIKIKVGEFSLNTTRLIAFTDLSVTPNMQIGLKELHLNISDLDSDKPQQKSPIELIAKPTGHGTIEIKGNAMPFETRPSFDATGKITGIDLRIVSPKSEQAIGHVIKSGQMDADLKLLSEQGQLDSEIALVLHHFNLKAKSKEDAAALDEIFGMPINQSLVLLKDKKGRIKLDIPITGDVNNPDFDPTDAIIKATAKATTVTLITFYTPYGLAFAGGNVLFNIATAMNFDPLIFDAGSSQLQDAHKEQLAKLTELLVERPHVHLTLCGFTSLNDRDKMFSEIINKEKIKPPSAERLKKLEQLGSERQDNVKNHLISIGNIAHDRLILCQPEHSDDTEASARVEISI